MVELLSTAALPNLRYIVLTIHGAGFQTVAIFMQTGDHDPEKSVAAADGIVTISDVVNDSPNKVHW